MRRRLTALALAAAALASVAAGPNDPPLPDPDRYSPFPFEVCVYSRYGTGEKVCLGLDDPR